MAPFPSRGLLRHGAAVLALALAGTAATLAIAHAEDVIRERQTVVVAGAREIWELVWDGEPKPDPVCGPDNVQDALTCPCLAFAYAETGKLSLVRRRDGHEIDRLDLSALRASGLVETMGAEGVTQLARWSMHEGDLDRSSNDDPKLAADIRRRPAPRIMKLAAYLQDGIATEFLLPVGSTPCGHYQYVAVGVSARDPKLHILSSAAHPYAPLVMDSREWASLLAGKGRTSVTVIPCGDHGSEREFDSVLWVENGTINRKWLSYACRSDGSVARDAPVEEPDE